MIEQILTPPDNGNAPLQHQHLLIGGVIVKILRKLFSDPSRLPASLRTHYNTDPTLSKLMITKRDSIQDHDWQRRPGIILRPNSLGTKRIGIGEGRLATHAPVGVENFNTLYIGSHTALCLSPRESESMLLAMLAQEHINRFQHEIRRGLCMLRLRVGDIGQPGLLKEARQLFATPFNIGYGYDQPYSVYPVSPKIRFINVNSDTK